MIALTIALAVLVGVSLGLLGGGGSIHLSSVQIDWALAAAVTAAALAGGLVGARLTSRVNPEALRKGFGWFVLAMSSVILAQEVHPAVGVGAGVATVVARAMAFSCRPICTLPVAASHDARECHGGAVLTPDTPEGKLSNTTEGVHHGW